jgi:lipopolysaccharide/colanic/teichoic acid biosynthesis glycosyltransferase
MQNDLSRVSTIRKQNVHRSNGQKTLFGVGRTPAVRAGVLEQETFHTMLTIERRRAERSRKQFVLMLFDAHALLESRPGEKLVQQIIPIISSSTRETDLIGWYKEGVILGVIFTEINVDGDNPITEVLHSKVVNALHEELDREIASNLIVSVHLFPESQDQGTPERLADIRLYPDIARKDSKRRLPLAVKRMIDFVGSGALLLVLSPVLAAIALAIKLTSKGSVIFEQERLGQFGRRFQCLKFRTMYTNNDPQVHQEYVQRFIAGQAESSRSENGEDRPVVFKITNDPRVTPVGRFLRKTSLDELPQFWNVLRGEMSLVGPRPPVQYEFDVYDVWHRRRVLEVKPGITGLWQVSGRSRTCFDDMVRLDLRYTQSWSLWLDLRILAATPRAVFTGDGAY